jgi:hypothetical protein
MAKVGPKEKRRLLSRLFLLVVAWRVAVAEDRESLSGELEQMSSLWLRDSGVEFLDAGGAVSAWTDVKGRHEFAPIAADKSRLLLQRVVARLRGGPSSKGLADTILSSDGRPRYRPGLSVDARPGSVSFPCGLVSRDLRLTGGMTVYLVLKPETLEFGGQAAGQRFFGHYPFGQMRFRDGLVAVRSDGGEYVLPNPAPAAGTWNLVAYRFGNVPEAALNGGSFRPMSALRGGVAKPVVFSAESVVTLGGTNVDCSFIGEISEVLVFDTLLSNQDASAVAAFLKKRHRLHDGADPTRAAGAAEAPRSTKIGAEGGGHPRGRPQRPTPPRRQRGGPQAPATTAGHISHALSEAQPGELRGFEYVTASMAPPVRSEESLKLLNQMEALKAQLDALMGDNGKGNGVLPAARPGNVRGSSTADKSECEGDAFRGMSVEGWQPPGRARLEDIHRWEDAYKVAFRDISHFEKGGRPLREFIHGKVNELKVLRQSLFCKYA